MIELSEKLIGMAPAPLAKAFFVNSGSEAIDTAIKLIWYYQNARGLPEKKKIIAPPARLSRDHHRRRPPDRLAGLHHAAASTCR